MSSGARKPALDQPSTEPLVMPCGEGTVSAEMTARGSELQRGGLTRMKSTSVQVIQIEPT